MPAGSILNRDFIKLEAPETQGLVRFLNQWNPHLFIDTHTTNGSYHRYTITYEGPKNPAGDPEIIRFMRKTFFPELEHGIREAIRPESVSTTGTSIATTPSGRPIRPRRGTERPTSD